MQKLIKTTHIIVLSCLLSLSISSVTLAKDYYKWKESNGSVLYTDKKVAPSKSAKFLGVVEMSSWRTNPSVASNSAPQATPSKTDTTSAAKGSSN